MLLSSSLALADVKKEANKQKNIEIKCHVVLIGGAETIHFINSEMKSPKQVAKFLKYKRILTTFSNKPKKIYQVKECVLSGASFSNPHANELEENTPN